MTTFAMAQQSGHLFRRWTIGDRLRAARESMDLDKNEFARVSGISRNTIARYEADEVKPNDSPPTCAASTEQAP